MNFKWLLVYVSIVAVVMLAAYPSHNYILTSNGLILSYDLLTVYIFNAVASVLVYFIVELVGWKLPTQVGYTFLGMVFFKVGFFVIIFLEPIFLKESLSMPERISVVVTLFMFLILEALFSARLMNSK